MGPDKETALKRLLTEEQYRELYQKISSALEPHFGKCVFAIVAYDVRDGFMEVVSNVSPLENTPRFLQEAAEMISDVPPHARTAVFPLES